MGASNKLKKSYKIPFRILDPFIATGSLDKFNLSAEVLFLAYSEQRRKHMYGAPEEPFVFYSPYQELYQYMQEDIKPAILAVMEPAFLEGRKLNKKEFLFISRELLRAFINRFARKNGEFFEAMLPAEKVVLFGKKARQKALEQFYSDVETAIYYKKLDGGAHPGFSLQDFKRHMDPEFKYERSFRYFLKQRGISYTKAMKDKALLKKERRLWLEKNKKDRLFIRDIVWGARQEIMRRHISVFGEPTVYAFSGESIYLNNYNSFVTIFNAREIKEQELDKLRTGVLSFQTLTAPTLSLANLNVNILYLNWKNKNKHKEGKSLGKNVTGYHNKSATFGSDGNVRSGVVIYDRAPTDANSIKSTIYHEMTHAIDEALPIINEQAFAILKGRCGERPALDVEILYEHGITTYGVRDSFLDPYIGRIYLHALRPASPELLYAEISENFPDDTPFSVFSEMWDNWPISKTEISSMAIDQFASPASMAGLLKYDLELFSHALAICYGTYVE